MQEYLSGANVVVAFCNSDIIVEELVNTVILFTEHSSVEKGFIGFIGLYWSIAPSPTHRVVVKEPNRAAYAPCKIHKENNTLQLQLLKYSNHGMSIETIYVIILL